MKQSFDRIIERLGSNDPAEQGTAMTDARTAFDAVADAAVSALERGPNRFIIAERLHPLGSILVPRLEKVVQQANAEEARILASLVLLQLGSKLGVPVLLQAVEHNWSYAGLSAAHLARAKVIDAAPIIISRLWATPLEEVDLCVRLIDALKGLGVALPPDLDSKLRQEGVPWQIRGSLS
jgi:hypothetical protein